MDQESKTPSTRTSLETDGAVVRDDNGTAGRDGNGGTNWTAAAAQSIWRHEKATPAELKFMATHAGVNDSQQVDAIKAQIESQAQEPEAALLQAVKDNRVVGFADMHVRQGPYFQYLIDEMPKLKAAGVTDVALEIPGQWQNEIDAGKFNGQNGMVERLTDGQSLLDVVDAAKKAGLKVTAVDEYYTGSGENLVSRDKTMADNIEQILQDPSKKVLYFVGAEHLASGYHRATRARTTVQRLRDDGLPVETFYQQLPSFPDGMIKSAKDLTRPISVDTKKADLLGEVRTAGFGQPPYGNFDNVIFYPSHYKMDNCESEIKQFGEIPGDLLKADLEKNRVLLLGENKRLNPDNPESGHRKLFSQLIPELQKNGLTDFALNVPASYQSQLDRYVQTGAAVDFPDLPEPYGGSGRADFRPVLDAVIKSGLTVHAVGEKIDYNTPMQSILDHLADNLETISKTNNGGKTLFWGDDMFVAKFFAKDKEVSVARSLNDAGVAATSVADFSQDFDKFSPDVVTQLIDQPVAIKPEQTRALRTIMNNERMQMDRFDQVIVYPSE